MAAAIDYSKFRMSLRRLEEQQENHRTLDSGLPMLMRDAVSESVIRRFKICCDSLCNVLRRYLIEELGISDLQNSPKPIFRRAHENGLLASPAEQWMRYAEARIGTSHDCDGEKAKACLELAPVFIEDAVSLYQTMTSAAWE